MGKSMSAASLFKTGRHEKFVPYLVLFLCLLGTLFAWHMASDYLQKELRARFAERANEITALIVKRIEANRTILRGGVALFSTNEQVSREQWRTYVETLRLKDTHPGIQGFGFAKVLKPSELSAHIEKIRAEGFPDYTVRPENRREVYTAITYLEPFDERNRRAFGYDMFSEPVRRTAMEEARDADRTTMSGKVKLVQETETDVQPGFLLYVPVYKKGMPTTTVGQRRAALFGYVYNPIRVKTFMQAAIGGPLGDLDLTVYDGTEPSEQSLIFDNDEACTSPSPDQQRFFTDKRVVNLYGHQWTLIISSGPSFEPLFERQAPPGILLSGLAISLLLFLFIRSQEDTRRRALVMANEMTNSLRKSEEELRQSSILLNSIVENIPNMIFLKDADELRFSLLNQAGVELLGISKQEITGKNDYDFFPREQADFFIEKDRQVLRDKETVDIPEEPLQTAHQGLRVLHTRKVPILDASGKAVYLLGISEDITVRQQAEMAAQESREKLDKAMESMTDAVFISDAAGQFTHFNEAFATFHRFKNRAECATWLTDYPDILDVFTADGELAPLEMWAVPRALRGERVKEAEYTLRRKDTVETWIGSYSFSPIYDKDGVIVGSVVVGRDITESKKAAQKLREANERFNNLVYQLNDVVWSASLDGSELVDVNRSFESIYGIPVEEFKKNPHLWLDMVHPDDRAIAEASGKELYEKGKAQAEYRIIRPDGSITWLLDRKSFIYDEHGAAVQIGGIAKDITERKRAENREHDRARILESLSSGASIATTLELIARGVETEDPGSLCSVLLLDEAGKHLLLGAAPSLPGLYNRAIHGLSIGDGVGSCGTAAFTRQRVIVADIATHPNWANFLELARQANLRSCWSEPILSAAGQVLGTFAIYHRDPREPGPEDIERIKLASDYARLAIERKRAEEELRTMNAELEQRVEDRTRELDLRKQEAEEARAQADKANQAKSDFLANMSHELRTPLNSILGFSELVRDGLVGEVNAKQREFLNDVWDSGRHLLRLINDILDISKIEAGKMELDPEEFDVGGLLNEALMFFREKSLRHGISLHCQVAEGLPTIIADERKIKQVLLNLLANAVKFTPDGGEVVVEAVAEGNEIQVSVRDTGIGIAGEDLGRLFQPFQQLESVLTKKYQGTGLGLHLCRKIVELHGGRIWVESEHGKGSRFTFAIPTAPVAKKVS